MRRVRGEMKLVAPAADLFPAILNQAQFAIQNQRPGFERMPVQFKRAIRFPFHRDKLLEAFLPQQFDKLIPFHGVSRFWAGQGSDGAAVRLAEIDMGLAHARMAQGFAQPHRPRRFPFLLEAQRIFRK